MYSLYLKFHNHLFIQQLLNTLLAHNIVLFAEDNKKKKNN